MQPVLGEIASIPWVSTHFPFQLPRAWGVSWDLRGYRSVGFPPESIQGGRLVYQWHEARRLQLRNHCIPANLLFSYESQLNCCPKGFHEWVDFCRLRPEGQYYQIVRVSGRNLRRAARVYASSLAGRATHGEPPAMGRGLRENSAVNCPSFLEESTGSSHLASQSEHPCTGFSSLQSTSHRAPGRKGRKLILKHGEERRLRLAPRIGQSHEENLSKYWCFHSCRG